MRLLGVVLATVLASSLGTLVACSAQDKDEENVPTAEAVSGASVQIAILDQNGNRIGDASGTLIAPRLVLTAGHAISGQYKWQVTSADGKQKVLGSRGMTYDWMTYDSQKAHPRRHDVGVIHLDEAIKLAAYPKLVSEKAAATLEATRIRGTGARFEQLPAVLKKVASSPNNWLAEMKGGETLDTGGAVYDERGIVGVVSGRGLTTGNLYVARVDSIHGWLSDKVACATPTGTRTYAPPAVDKSAAECDDAGNPLSSSGTPGTSGTPSGSSSGGPSSGGGDGSCSGNDDGVCSGAGCGTGGPNLTHPNGDDDDDNGPNGGDDGGGNGSGVGSSGSNGNHPNGPNGSNPGQSSGETGKGGGGGNGTVSSSSGGGSGGDGEACQGESDNPEVCPPEPKGCVGAGCGGGTPDDLIDYGACACASNRGDDDLHVH